MARLGSVWTVVATATFAVWSTSARSSTPLPQSDDAVDTYDHIVHSPGPTPSKRQRSFQLGPDWSGSVGLLSGICLRQRSTTTDGESEPVPCVSDFDATSEGKENTLAYGLSANLSNAITRRLSIVGSFFYEPDSHTANLAVTADYTLALRRSLTLTQSIGLSAPFGASGHRPADPVSLIGSETLGMTRGRWLFSGGAFGSLSYGTAAPIGLQAAISAPTQLRLPPPPPKPGQKPDSRRIELNQGDAHLVGESGSAYGVNVEADVNLSRRWSLASSLAISWATTTTTELLEELTPLSVILHYGSWQDTLSLDAAMIGASGQASFGAEFATQWNF